MQITEKEILRKIKALEAYKPPWDLASQQAILFAYRMSLQTILVLLERIEEKNKLIQLKEKGNSDLTALLEKWIISNPSPKKR